MEKVSFFEILFSFILWLIIYAISSSFYKKRISSKSTYYLKYSVFSIIFCTFAYYVGDFPHYAILYKECLTSSTPIHVEPVYFWIIKNMSSGYLMWRCIVWGGAIILWIRMYKRIGIHAKYACIMMTLILLYYFSAPRQSLAFAIMFYSLTYIFYPNKSKVLSYIIAILGVYLSFYFHKSMIMYTLLLILAFIPFKKTYYIASFILFPVFYGAILFLSVYIIGFIFADNALDTGMNYLESESQGGFTGWGWIQFAVTRIPIFYSIIFCVWYIFSKKESIPYIFKILIQYAYICTYIGLLFFQQETSSFLSPRFLDATYYPLSIILPYFLSEKSKSKKMKVILNLFLLSNIYLFAYTLYKS